MGSRKVLVTSLDNAIIGLYRAPLVFSISGKYVIDIPNNIIFDTLPGSVDEVFLAKRNGLIALNPTLNNVFSGDVTELPSQIDTSLSNGYIINDAGITLFPGGGIMTNVFSPLNAFNSIYLHYYGFFLERITDPSLFPFPPPILYNYDPILEQFVEFDPASIQVDIMDSTGSETLYTPTPDQLYSANFGDFRIQFINLTSEFKRLSEYILLYNLIEG
jgi:hypothetical protein